MPPVGKVRRLWYTLPLPGIPKQGSTHGKRIFLLVDASILYVTPPPPPEVSKLTFTKSDSTVVACPHTNAKYHRLTLLRRPSYRRLLGGPLCRLAQPTATVVPRQPPVECTRGGAPRRERCPWSCVVVTLGGSRDDFGTHASLDVTRVHRVVSHAEPKAPYICWYRWWYDGFVLLPLICSESGSESFSSGGGGLDECAHTYIL